MCCAFPVTSANTLFRRPLRYAHVPYLFHAPFCSTEYLQSNATLSIRIYLLCHLYSYCCHPFVPGARQRRDEAVRGGHSSAMCWWLDGGAQADTTIHHQHGWDYRLRNGLVEDISVGVARTALEKLGFDK